jgi:hypothetical protein
MPVVSPELLAIVRAQRKEDERIAWAMCPDPEAFAASEKSLKRAKRRDATAILAAGYTSLGAGAMALRSADPRWLLIPVAILLIVVAAYGVSGWRRARERRALKGTVYVLTTRRALTLHTYPALRVQEVPLDTIADVAVTSQQQDLGDVSFTAKSSAAAPLLVFRGVFEPERARKQMLKVLGDPGAADREIANSEAYLQAMHKFARSVQIGGS